MRRPKTKRHYEVWTPLFKNGRGARADSRMKDMAAAEAHRDNLNTEYDRRGWKKCRAWIEEVTVIHRPINPAVTPDSK